MRGFEILIATNLRCLDTRLHDDLFCTNFGHRKH